MKDLKKFQIEKENQKLIKGGNFKPPVNGECPSGWYLCPANDLCVFDNGGSDPITPDHPYYKKCFG
ncbi:hypothetical protein SAMN05421738_10397 [Algoriella xinjiangensis]|uniref:Bacteriocin-type signal sequence-containing protein n=1 Tax=Algoriella xinjiangensis TaxID=684065 RepID=A0A1I4U6A1_9FLAO|nr:hypothetical protein [Algoriella xinjiangensis]SFM84544.1 hypothetical protein SAMN05421738_10397 [Algoriella xinjiangensis]VDH17869.1 Uncharacterised protein [Algoriella xinjiangensis]